VTSSRQTGHVKQKNSGAALLGRVCRNVAPAHDPHLSLQKQESTAYGTAPGPLNGHRQSLQAGISSDVPVERRLRETPGVLSMACLALGDDFLHARIQRTSRSVAAQKARRGLSPHRAHARTCTHAHPGAAGHIPCAATANRAGRHAPKPNSVHKSGLKGPRRNDDRSQDQRKGKSKPSAASALGTRHLHPSGTVSQPTPPSPQAHRHAWPNRGEEEQIDEE
jgi:hypothetical protein